MKHTPGRIVDASGRIGIVTETRERGLFARPVDVPYIIGGNVPGINRPHQIITATWWTLQPDGTYRGGWYDSPLGASVIAKAEGRG